jgi:hypothetical protein
MDHCCLCGIHLDGLKRRYQSPRETSRFIRECCKPSPFLYAPLSNLECSPPRQGICIPCVNWKRRVETIGLRRTRQPKLQMDQLICYLLQPGAHAEPDHRCMERLIQAARQPGNPYRALFPVPVQTILDAVQENTFHACVVAWWAYNGNTEFFASGQEARRVRCALKADPQPLALGEASLDGGL